MEHKRARAGAQKFLRNIKRRPCGHGSGLPMGRPASDAEQHQHHTRLPTWGNLGFSHHPLTAPGGPYPTHSARQRRAPRDRRSGSGPRQLVTFGYSRRWTRLAAPSWRWGGPRRPGLPARTLAAVLGHPGRPGGDVLPSRTQGRRKTWKGLRERWNPVQPGTSPARHHRSSTHSAPSWRIQTTGTPSRNHSAHPSPASTACIMPGLSARGRPGCVGRLPGDPHRLEGPIGGPLVGVIAGAQREHAQRAVELVAAEVDAPPVILGHGHPGAAGTQHPPGESRSRLGAQSAQRVAHGGVYLGRARVELL